MVQRLYIESDGRVFLVSRGQTLDLPMRAEVPFEVEIIAPLCTSSDVLFCVPRLSSHPSEWMSKDATPADARVSSIVREAVHATMPRVVAEAVVVHDGRILLVKGSRGLTQGLWSLPGGFVRFGEDPAAGLARELEEELRVHASVEDLLVVRSKLGARSRLHWTMFFYRAVLSGEPRPDPDEVAEAGFFLPRDARENLTDPVLIEVLDSIAFGAG